MTKYREILKLHSQGFSQRDIAAACGCSRNTVARVLDRAEEKGAAWPLPDDMNDRTLKERLFGVRRSSEVRKEPDYDYVHKELAKSGVTLNLLWNEYCEACRREGSVPFMYTQFCNHYQAHALKTKATMRIAHKPGERMEVDWAGTTMSITDNITGKPIAVYLFVAVLPYSQYSYAEGFLSQKQDCWVAGHTGAYEHFGGSTRILVPDNLKTGVVGYSNWYTPDINKVYHEMAEHYQTAVIPARVKRPKDKPSVEGSVGSLSTWIIGALRNRQFFSLGELNTAVKQKLAEFNAKPFQKRPGSRESVLEEERPFLIPLPAKPFEMAVWKVATVQLNYHISVEKMNYSVPYEYIKHKVDVRLTRDMVEVFYGGNRIASHVRLHGYPGQYAAVGEHMPREHRQYSKWNAERFVSWARDIGKNTETVICSMLASRKVEEQAYKSCIALLKLADRHSVENVELACERALSYSHSSAPSLRSIQAILKNGMERKPIKADGEEASPPRPDYGFTRGAAYYGRKDDDN